MRPQLPSHKISAEDALALQLQGAFEVRLLRHRLVTSSPDGPGDDERRLDPALR
jgi:hypothetical protein